MPETIPLPFKLSPKENVLLTRDYLGRRKKAADIVKASQQAARKIIKQANIEAEKIRKGAMQEGREAAIFHCLDTLLTDLHFRQKETERFREKIISLVEEELSGLMFDADLLASLIEKWRKANPVEDGLPLMLRVHACKAAMAQDIANRLLQHHRINVHIILDDKQGCHVRQGDHVLELTPEAYSKHIVSRSALDQQALQISLEQLSDETRKKLAEKFNLYKESDE